MIATLILLGLFTVYVINTKAVKPAIQADRESLLNISSAKPTTTLNINSTTPTPATSLQAENITITIKTTKGDIELTLYSKEAPNTVKNFLAKAQSEFYVNKIFHRVEDWVIQGGDPLGNGTGGEQMLTELNNKPFVTGSLGVARGGDIRISNDSQFFVTKIDASWLNGQYTNFGIVTKGIDIINSIEIGDKILAVQRNP